MVKMFVTSLNQHLAEQYMDILHSLVIGVPEISGYEYQGIFGMDTYNATKCDNTKHNITQHDINKNIYNIDKLVTKIYKIFEYRKRFRNPSIYFQRFSRNVRVT